MFRCYSPHYITNREHNPLPRLTIVGEHKNNLLKLSAARCSLKDRFVRKTGREIAEERLKNGKCLLEVKTRKCNSQIFHEYAEVLMNNIWSSKTFLF